MADKIKHKQCSPTAKWGCGKTKPVTEFYKSAYLADGYKGICKDCSNDYADYYKSQTGYEQLPYVASEERKFELARIASFTEEERLVYIRDKNTKRQREWRKKNLAKMRKKARERYKKKQEKKGKTVKARPNRYKDIED